MSTTRWIIETECEHGRTGDCDAQTHGLGRYCLGGSRVVVDPDNLPPEAIQRAAQAIGDVTGIEWEMFMAEAEAAVRAFLSDPEPGDQT